MKYFLYTALLFLLFQQVGCRDTEMHSELKFKPVIEKTTTKDQYFGSLEHLSSASYRTELTKITLRNNTHQEFDVACKELSVSTDLLIENGISDDSIFCIVNQFLIANSPKIRQHYWIKLQLYRGMHFVLKSDLEKAIDCLTQLVIRQPDSYESTVSLAHVHLLLARIYSNTGKQHVAITHSEKANSYLNSIHAQGEKQRYYSVLSYLYSNVDNYKKAESAMNTAIYYAQLKKDTFALLKCSLQRVNIYQRAKNFAYFSEVKRLHKRISALETTPPLIQVIDALNYAQILLIQGNALEAKKTLYTISPILERYNFVVEKEMYSFLISNCEIEQKSPLSTKKVLEEQLPLLKKKQDYISLRNIYYLFKQDAISRGDFKQALFYSVEMEGNMNLLASREMKIKFTEIETKYKTQEKTQQLVLQKLQLRKNNQLIIILILSLLGTFLGILGYYLFQKQKKMKLDTNQKELFTNMLIQHTEEERKRIANDLHDVIGHELLTFKQMLGTEFQSLNEKVDLLINDLRGISRNLHPIMFEKLGLKEVVEQLVERLQQHEQLLFICEINYSGSLSSKTELQIYRIIQESLSNCIKYAQAHAVKINIQEQNNQIIVEIKDSGIGFNVQETMASNKAFGLLSILERSHSIQGIPSITSSPKGTVIRIQLNRP
jgi:two-component system NarL family sensor kinase